ncbi:MAG TPA: flagellar motor protein MotB [Oceanipulchritudo sp.]|nr:flagellar motor protein MotB [Oceanipulchritudo sp.]
MAKHGGAWKVAYADFITAMMALFMVLWILGSEQELLEQMQEYFRNPPSPWDQISGKFLVDMGDNMGLRREGEAENALFEKMDPAVIRGIVENLYKALQIDVSSAEIPPVELVITSDGLRLVIYDREDSPMFEEKSDTLTEWGDFLLQNLAWILSRKGFEAVIEGHAEPGMQETGDGNGPWELSLNRANTVRQSLEFYAAGDVGIQRVSGMGSQAPLEESLRVPGRTNQRITVSLSLPN